MALVDNNCNLDKNDDDDECELKSLNWLTELKNVGYIQLSEGPLIDVPMARFNKFVDGLKIDRGKFKQDEQFYKTNTHEKPQFNYATLIGISLMENGRMTLQQIYDWIQENFAFYNYCGTNWQSSIRHNLSLGLFFKNSARGENERGKGGYWELALDTRKTQWKRNRKSRKNKSHDGKNQHQSLENGHKKTFGKNLNNNNVSKSSYWDSKLAKVKNSQKDGQKQLKLDDNSTEITLTFETEIDAEELSTKINENTPIEFADINFNNQIFQANEIPQAVDDIEVPFFSNMTILPAVHSPNVVVETLPYNLPPLEEYNFTTTFNEQKIFEDLLEYENEML